MVSKTTQQLIYESLVLVEKTKQYFTDDATQANSGYEDLVLLWGNARREVFSVYYGFFNIKKLKLNQTDDGWFSIPSDLIKFIDPQPSEWMKEEDGEMKIKLQSSSVYYVADNEDFSLLPASMIMLIKYKFLEFMSSRVEFTDSQVRIIENGSTKYARIALKEIVGMNNNKRVANGYY